MLQFLIMVPFCFEVVYYTGVFIHCKINTIDNFYVSKDKFISPYIVVGCFSAAHVL